MNGTRWLRAAIIAAGAYGITGCTTVRETIAPPPEVLAERASRDADEDARRAARNAEEAARRAAREEADEARRIEALRERARDAVPATPETVQPASSAA